MKKLIFGTLFLTQIICQTPDSEIILKKIDENMSASNQVIVSKMVIHGRRGSRSIIAKSWIQGANKSFTEYIAPARDKGTKMLKIDDKLWMYSPQSDRVIRISGHMLRMSLMGSDLSYEDMMEERKLTQMYSAKIIGEEPIDDHNCWVLELTAKEDDLTYHSQKLWVDKEYFVPRRQQLFAKSGKLLKVVELSDFINIDNRWYPKKMLFQDALIRGQGTEFIIESIKFDENIPNRTFSKAALRK